MNFNIPKNVLKEFDNKHVNAQILYYRSSGSDRFQIHEIFFKTEFLIGIFIFDSVNSHTTFLTKRDIKRLNKFSEQLEF